MVPHVRRKDCELGGGTLGPHMRLYTGGCRTPPDGRDPLIRTPFVAWVIGKLGLGYLR